MRWARRTVEAVYPDAPDRWGPPAGLLLVDTADGTLVRCESERQRRPRWKIV